MLEPFSSPQDAHRIILDLILRQARKDEFTDEQLKVLSFVDGVSPGSATEIERIEKRMPHHNLFQDRIQFLFYLAGDEIKKIHGEAGVKWFLEVDRLASQMEGANLIFYTVGAERPFIEDRIIEAEANWYRGTAAFGLFATAVIVCYGVAGMIADHGLDKALKAIKHEAPVWGPVLLFAVGICLLFLLIFRRGPNEKNSRD